MYTKGQRVYIPALESYGEIIIVHANDMYTIELESGMRVVRYGNEIEPA